MLEPATDEWRESEIPVIEEETTVANSPKPLEIWNPSRFLSYEEPPGYHFLLPRHLSRAQITSIIGPPGVGKSHLALWLAVRQMTGQDWCGLKTSGGPSRWLFLGDENSIQRFKEDLQCIFGALTREQAALVQEHLFIQVIQQPEDGDLDLLDERVFMRVSLTLDQVHPDVVVFDTLSAFVSCDVSKPGDMKTAVRHIEKVLRQSCPEAAVLVLHHARPGRSNIQQAAGFDAGNFASGGKALLARSRCVINLAPEDEKNNGRVVLVCAKSNNCESFLARCVELDAGTMSYAIVEDWSFEAWRAKVEGKRTSGSSLCTVKDVVDCVREGKNKTGAIIADLNKAYGCARATVERMIQRALSKGFLKKLKRGHYILGPKHNLLNDNG